MTVPDTYTDYTLRRDGDAPLTFRGRLLAEASSQTRSGPTETRWHELALYEVEPDPGAEETRAAGVEWPREYLVAVGWRTRWQGEGDADAVLLAEDGLPLSSGAEVALALRQLDPLWAFVGYPPGEAYAEKQERLRTALLRGWDRAVSDLLATLPAPLARRGD